MIMSDNWSKFEKIILKSIENFKENINNLSQNSPKSKMSLN